MYKNKPGINLIKLLQAIRVTYKCSYIVSEVQDNSCKEWGGCKTKKNPVGGV